MKTLYKPLTVDFTKLDEQVAFDWVGAIQGFQSLIFIGEAISAQDKARFKRTLETLHFAASNPLMAACAAGLEALAQQLTVDGQEYGLNQDGRMQMAALLTTLVNVMRGN